MITFIRCGVPVDYVPGAHLIRQFSEQEEKYSPKVSPLMIDKLSLTIDIPPQYQAEIVYRIRDLDGWKSHRSHYQWNLSIPLKADAPLHLSADLTEESHLRISADPKDQSYRFLRVEFNPAMIDMEFLSGAIADLLPPPLNYQFVMTTGGVTRIDWAVDISAPLDALHFHSLRKQWSQVINKSGKSLYLGHTTSTSQFCIYDKANQVMEKNRKKHPSLKQPKPVNPITRVEVRQHPKGKATLEQLPLMSNPFDDLMTFQNVPNSLTDQDELLRMTFALARHEGLSSALRRLNKPTRKKYLKQLAPYQADWWRPAEIWAGAGDILDDVIHL